jgi:hypothetical protein
VNELWLDSEEHATASEASSSRAEMLTSKYEQERRDLLEKSAQETMELLSHQKEVRGSRECERGGGTAGRDERGAEKESGGGGGESSGRRMHGLSTLMEEERKRTRRGRRESERGRELEMASLREVVRIAKRNEGEAKVSFCIPLDDYYFNIYANTLTIVFYICYFGLDDNY